MILKVIILKFFTFGIPILVSMKKLLIPVIVVAAFMLFYEQGKEKPNVYITVAAIAVLMFGLMKLNTKIPHKDNDKDQNNVL